MIIGDRVKAMKPLTKGLIPIGALGTIVGKHVPVHATICWHIDIQFDGFEWKVRLPYPDCGIVEKVKVQ